MKNSMFRKILENYNKKFNMPYFRMNSNQVEIVNTPSEFFEIVMKGIKESKFRVSMATLYIGCGSYSKRIMEELYTSSEKNQNLKIKLV